MKEKRKWLAIAIIVLFVGMSIAPSIMGVEKTDLISSNDVLDLSPIEIIIDGILGNNGWYVSCVTITIIAEGEAIWYLLDDGTLMVYSVPFIVCDDGYHIIYAFSIDPYGNQSSAQAEFKIDQTPPTIWLTVEKIGDYTWMIIADVYDETSGVAKVEFYVNGEYVGEATEYPYVWIYNITPSTGFSVKGIILNPKITEETVSFFAVIAIGCIWHSNPNCPSAQAIAYDNAGNVAINPVSTSPIDDELYVYIFDQLTFSNDYSGRIGRFFINAIFEDEPV